MEAIFWIAIFTGLASAAMAFAARLWIKRNIKQCRVIIWSFGLRSLPFGGREKYLSIEFKTDDPDKRIRPRIEVPVMGDFFTLEDLSKEYNAVFRRTKGRWYVVALEKVPQKTEPRSSQIVLET